MKSVNFLIVFLGSGLGGVLRYGLSNFVGSHTNGLFPWGTFAVNMIGCLLIGLIYGLVDKGSRN